MIAYLPMLLKFGPYALIGLLITMFSCQTIKLNASQEMVKAKAERIDVFEIAAKGHAADMAFLREKVTEREDEIVGWQKEAAKTLAAMELADELALELAAAESDLARVEAENEAFEARLQPLSLCKSYLVTLVEIVGGGLE